MILPLDTFLSASTNDMVSEFVSWRTYLADSLPHGHLPLWNSITYGGYPFLGGFESAVLYPPNLLSLSLSLCLPLPRALNFSMLLHLVTLGWGIEATGQASWPKSVGGKSGRIFWHPSFRSGLSHIYAGHLPALCTMNWAPWLFLGLETWIWHNFWPDWPRRASGNRDGNADFFHQCTQGEVRSIPQLVGRWPSPMQQSMRSGIDFQSITNGVSKPRIE